MQPVLTIKNLFKRYGQGDWVLNGISLEIAAGQVIGYIGPNGAGKSTTVKILTGLLPDFEGEVSILGMDLRKELLNIKSRIGYIPENAELYEVLTPLEYLHFVGSMYDMDRQEVQERALRMLDSFGLSSHANDRMESFSKGMKQKVLIISGLIHNPEIIFMDEPLSGLDANSVILVKEIIAKLAAEGKVVFYSSHMMDIVEKVSDRIILIHNGRVQADGSFTELQQQAEDKNLEGLFARLTGGDVESGSRIDAFMDAFERQTNG